MKQSWMLVIGLFATLYAPAYAANEDAAARYQSLLIQAKSGSPNIDWQALRFAYADQPGINVLDDGLNPIRAKMMAARKDTNFSELLNQANLLIEKDYVDAQGHLMAYVADRALGRLDDAAREQGIAVGLFKSMQTGDGLSPSHAFTVINVREEYQLVSARQRKVIKQSLLIQDSHHYDALDTVGLNKDKVTFYFLIDRVLNAESALRTRKP